MKLISLLLSLISCISISNAQKKQAEDPQRGRITKVINSQWTFNYFPSETADKGYESPGFNDSRWPAISIPHTWNSYETTGELLPFTRSPGETGETFWWTGWGWYRKHFLVSSDLSVHKVFIEFRGVQKYCKVWINGKYAGDHKGGYGSFDFDISSFINPGGDNLLAVAVSYLQKDEFKMHPLTEGSLNASCGIYRDVSLVLKNKLYIPMQGSASHEGGTFITTPGVSEKEGIVKVKTWVKNDYPQTKTCILQTTISDRNNQIVQIIKTIAEIDPGQLYMFRQISKPVKNPHLWSVDDPYLYAIHSELIEKKEIIDTCSGRFGFRWFRYDENNNAVYLNDRKIELSGVNRHGEYPWLGDAIPDWITATDYSELSGKGGKNFVRTTNHPGDENSYDLSDLHGIITEEDFTSVTGQGFSAEEQKQQIMEMIRRDRNHPAIICWNLGNDENGAGNKALAVNEDSTRRIGSIRARIDSASGFNSYRNKKDAPVPNNVNSAEAAKIIVSSSHSRINADRGSIAIITADITDANGNHAAGARNTIRWQISGPAKLVGPAYYLSYADSGRNPGEGWYLEMPATNILRSTGIPGKIRVTVFSGGVASGSVEIDAGEFKPDNTIINEPVLADAGRKAVTGNSLAIERLEEIPREISLASEDFNMPLSDKAGFNRLIRDYIKRNNPLTDTLSIEFKTLTDLLALQLFNNKGSLPSADYNFNVEHYNTCRLISGYITKTKLPPLFKESLRNYYSTAIIRRGDEKNAGDEMNWLNWIPSGGIIVIVPDEVTNTGQKGIVFTRQTGLPDIIRAVYPQFAKFSEDARERALIFISRMNPNVHVNCLNKDSLTAGADTGDAFTYTAEKGQPILIPEYKFISE